MLEPACEKEGRFSSKANSGSGSSEDGESYAPSEKAEEKREAITSPSTPWHLRLEALL